MIAIVPASARRPGRLAELVLVAGAVSLSSFVIIAVLHFW
jgi:hypothetical protein